MGWWTDKTHEQETLQGDAPYDILSQAFKDIAREYMLDWNRKPRLRELIRSIEVVLNSSSEQFIFEEESIELTSLISKTRKRKRFQSYKVGDFFTIPLSNGSIAYGRILSNVQQKSMGMLVGIYNQITEHVIYPAGITDKSFMFPPFFCSDEGWTMWKQKILDHEPIGPDEFQFPKFKLGTESTRWRIIEGDQIIDATAEEVKDLEYAALWSLGSVEWRIEEELIKRQS